MSYKPHIIIPSSQLQSVEKHWDQHSMSKCPPQPSIITEMTGKGFDQAVEQPHSPSLFHTFGHSLCLCGFTWPWVSIFLCNPLLLPLIAPNALSFRSNNTNFLYCSFVVISVCSCKVCKALHMPHLIYYRRLCSTVVREHALDPDRLSS